MRSREQDDLENALAGLDASGLVRFVEGRGDDLDDRVVGRVLRHPFADESVVAALVARRRVIAGYNARARIARHPRSGATTALRFVPGLYWRDLLNITVDTRVSPSVRRVAERYLLGRLPALAIGERIVIARRAVGSVMSALRRDNEPRVIDAWLDNPRLTEAEVLPLVVDRSVHPRVLDRVARKTRWRGRYGIRAALSRNPRTPLGVQLALLSGLRRDDLLPIVNDTAHSSIVRHRARELADERLPRRVRGGLSR